MIRRSFALAVVACVLSPVAAVAQPAIGVGAGVGPPGWGGPAAWSGPGTPMWNYHGLAGGPYARAWPGYYGWGWPWYGYGFSGATGSYWTNGLSLYGPPVPTYGPIPGVFGANDLNRQWAAHPSLGWNYGWVGIYAASPRPRPQSVSVWPVVEPAPATAANTGAPGGCLYLSVKVPQPAAEVFVNGVRMTQTGTDRLYESPPVESGKDARYELTARWIERGATVERTKIVTGKPGEVVRVDFLAPDVITTGR